MIKAMIGSPDLINVLTDEGWKSFIFQDQKCHCLKNDPYRHVVGKITLCQIIFLALSFHMKAASQM